MTNKSHSFTFVYGMKAIIPTKIGMPTVKTFMQNQRDNDEELKRQLNWANEKQKAKSCGYPNNFLPSDGNFSVQQKGMTTVFFFFTRIFGSQKSL